MQVPSPQPGSLARGKCLPRRWGRAQPAVPEDLGNKLVSQRPGTRSNTAVSSHRGLERGPWVLTGHLASKVLKPTERQVLPALWGSCVQLFCLALDLEGGRK